MAGLAVPSWELAFGAAVHTASRLKPRHTRGPEREHRSPRASPGQMPLLGSDVRHGGLRVGLLANLRGSCARCEGVHAMETMATALRRYFDESGFEEDGGYASD